MQGGPWSPRRRAGVPASDYDTWGRTGLCCDYDLVVDNDEVERLLSRGGNGGCVDVRMHTRKGIACVLGEDGEDGKDEMVGARDKRKDGAFARREGRGVVRHEQALHPSRTHTQSAGIHILALLVCLRGSLFVVLCPYVLTTLFLSSLTVCFVALFFFVQSSCNHPKPTLFLSFVPFVVDVLLFRGIPKVKPEFRTQFQNKVKIHLRATSSRGEAG